MNPHKTIWCSYECLTISNDTIIYSLIVNDEIVSRKYLLLMLYVINYFVLDTEITHTIYTNHHDYFGVHDWRCEKFFFYILHMYIYIYPVYVYIYNIIYIYNIYIYNIIYIYTQIYTHTYKYTEHYSCM